ncbi:MAG: hypothetical protein HQL40_13565 [Alphaproteobacteria bacterium]|nr:hypothetical protein [Alphaproteobacteria bacterium]
MMPSLFRREALEKFNAARDVDHPDLLLRWRPALLWTGVAAVLAALWLWPGA